MGARRRTGAKSKVLVATLSTAVVLAALLLGALPAVAASKPTFQMPFACGERWEGSSRPSHSPSPFAVDWNRDANDAGHIVVATAPGVVTSVVDLGSTSYGLYVVVDHGNGWTTLHAHLQRSFVVTGERVDQGQVIALLGNSGGSTGAHLHYEQRLDKTDQHAYFNADAFAYDSWLTSRGCGDVPVTGDWNGDRRSDVGVFRRQAGGGTFRERLPEGTRSVTSLGLSTDQPVVGDWDADGESEPGTFNPATATFTLQTASGGHHRISFGQPGDLPISGDWNSDGFFDVGVFHPATSTFSLRGPGGSISTRKFGSVSSLPVAGDWNGDGRWEVGVYDPAITRFSLALADGSIRTVGYGTPTSVPTIGFWNGGGVSDLGVWDRTTGTFYERLGPHRTTTIRFGRVR